jgi:curved DNA-binding protein CbpA
MNPLKDYYDILLLTPDARLEDIKKAYRSLSLKDHPLKTQRNKEEAENLFRLIGESYSVLSDPDQRRSYDIHIHSHPEKPRTMSSYTFSDARDLFNRFFGNTDPFFAFFSPDDEFLREHSMTTDPKPIQGQDRYQIYGAVHPPQLKERAKIHTEALPNKTGRTIQTKIEDKNGEKIKTTVITSFDSFGNKESEERVEIIP